MSYLICYIYVDKKLMNVLNDFIEFILCTQNRIHLEFKL